MSLNNAWLYLSQNQERGYGGGGLGDSGGPALWTDPSTGVGSAKANMGEEMAQELTEQTRGNPAELP